MLTVSAEHEETDEEKKENYVRRERRYGSFSRSVTLPKGVTAEGSRRPAATASSRSAFPSPRRKSTRPSRSPRRGLDAHAAFGTAGSCSPCRPHRGPPRVAVFAPSPVLTITVESLAPSEDEIHIHAGGQGFWVARLAAILGPRSRSAPLWGASPAGCSASCSPARDRSCAPSRGEPERLLSTTAAAACARRWRPWRARVCSGTRSTSCSGR